jgi:hypothetical protein
MSHTIAIKTGVRDPTAIAAANTISVRVEETIDTAPSTPRYIARFVPLSKDERGRDQDNLEWDSTAFVTACGKAPDIDTELHHRDSYSPPRDFVLLLQRQPEAPGIVRNWRGSFLINICKQTRTWSQITSRCHAGWGRAR